MGCYSLSLYDTTTSSIEFFTSVTDPQVERTLKYSPNSILFISLCAVICGAESWNEIVDYGNANIDWLEKFLSLPNCIPSHDFFNREINMNAKLSSMDVKEHRKKDGCNNDYLLYALKCFDVIKN